MSGLTSETYKDVREALLDCAPLGGDAEVRAVFANPHLAIWRNRVPSGYSPTGRADLLIDFLHDKANTKGQNALALFLLALGENLPEGEECRRQLLSAATAVARETGTTLPGEAPEEPTSTGPGTIEHSSEAEKQQARTINYYFYGTVIGDIRHASDNIREKREGDTFEMSGDFRNAIVNLKSHIDNSKQLVEQLPDSDPETKEELVRSVTELERKLAELPAARADEAETIARRVKDLLEEAGSSRPDTAEVEIRGESLKRAAENVKEILPTVLTIATTIVQHVTALV